jgi:peptidoglycan/LPS O-acetylase OafA/YrhL
MFGQMIKINNNNPTLSNRPEINGLRAFAIMAVLIFHADRNILPGGYLGVDIFFVISGYLITKIIITEVMDGRFSYSRFIHKRIRRIVPAMFFVVLVSAPLLATLMTPPQLSSMLESIHYIGFFASNVFFMRDNGYFGGDIELKPFIHTWTISVEWQFYCIAPLAIVLALRMLPRYLTTVIVIGLLLSLAAMEWVGKSYQDAAFFLLPTRAWEFLIGSLASTVKLDRVSEGLSNLISFIAMLCLALCVTAFSQDVRHPSLLTFIPVCCAALVILFSRHGTLIHWVLCRKPLVMLGLISYSVYLWHQVFFVSIRLYFHDQVSTMLLFSAGAISIGVAFVSWKFIEQPFRMAGDCVNECRRTIIIGAGASLIMILVGYGGKSIVSSGSFRDAIYSKELQVVIDEYEGFLSTVSDYRLRECFLDKQQSARSLTENGCLERLRPQALILVGDSHAAHLYSGLKARVSAEVDLVQLTAASCRPFMYPSYPDWCLDFLDLISRELRNANQDADIVISANWFGSYESLGEEVFREAIYKAFSDFSPRARRVVIVGQIPVYNTDGWLRQLIRLNMLPSNLISVSNNVNPVNRELKKIALHFGYMFVDPTSLFCDGDSLRCDTIRNGELLYFDRGHLRPAGSEIVAKSVLEGL